jgi:uncharacterized membrane protein
MRCGSASWGAVSVSRDQREVGASLLERPSLGAAAVFYVLYLAAMTDFCVMLGLAWGAFATAVASAAVACRGVSYPGT